MEILCPTWYTIFLPRIFFLISYTTIFMGKFVWTCVSHWPIKLCLKDSMLKCLTKFYISFLYKGGLSIGDRGKGKCWKSNLNLLKKMNEPFGLYQRFQNLILLFLIPKCFTWMNCSLNTKLCLFEPTASSSLHFHNVQWHPQVFSHRLSCS